MEQRESEPSRKNRSTTTLTGRWFRIGPLRFENLVAAHLIKWVHFQQDTEGRDLELRYFRDVTGREVDFVVTESGKPFMFIECKWDDAPVNKALRYLKKRFPLCPAYQIAATGKKDFETSRRDPSLSGAAVPS